VKHLFVGHRQLILGFNTFLPRGLEIILPRGPRAGPPGELEVGISAGEMEGGVEEQGPLCPRGRCTCGCRRRCWRWGRGRRQPGGFGGKAGGTLGAHPQGGGPQGTEPRAGLGRARAWAVMARVSSVVSPLGGPRARGGLGRRGATSGAGPQGYPHGAPGAAWEGREQGRAAALRALEV